MPASDKLKMPPKTKRAALPEMRVNVSAPDVRVTPTFDTAKLAAAIDRMSAIMTQLAKQQESLLKALGEQYQVMQVLAQREAKIAPPSVKVSAPKVSIPPRPRGFNVEIQRPGEEPTLMRVEADKMN